MHKTRELKRQKDDAVEAAARKAELNEAAKSLHLTAKCTSKHVKLRVSGHRALVQQIRFKLGSRVVGTDSRAPYVRTITQKRYKKHRGTARAVVRRSNGGLTKTKTISVLRPRC